jgi:hypothetical protein
MCTKLRKRPTEGLVLPEINRNSLAAEQQFPLAFFGGLVLISLFGVMVALALSELVDPL